MSVVLESSTPKKNKIVFLLPLLTWVLGVVDLTSTPKPNRLPLLNSHFHSVTPNSQTPIGLPGADFHSHLNSRVVDHSDSNSLDHSDFLTFEWQMV